MARHRAARNAITGHMEPDSGARNIFFDAFHDTGAFDPRMHDPDFLSGREAIPKRRVVAPLTLWPGTVEDLERLAKAMNMSRGRVVDRLVSMAVKQLNEHEEKHPEGRLPMVEDYRDGT